MVFVTCKDCGLAQLSHNYNLKELYNENYGYRSVRCWGSYIYFLVNPLEVFTILDTRNENSQMRNKVSYWDHHHKHELDGIRFREMDGLWLIGGGRRYTTVLGSS